MSLLSGALVLALLIATNALYVAAEFGAVSARRTKIRELADGGHRQAVRIAPVLEDPRALDRWIAACQVGITLSSLALGAFGESKLAPVVSRWLLSSGIIGELSSAHQVASVSVLLSLTTVQMVAGELIPKSLAMRFPTQATLHTALWVQLSARLLGGFITALNGTSDLLLAALGYRRPRERPAVPAEEIGRLIAESSDGGALEPAVREPLLRALALSSRRVRELMVPRTKVTAIGGSAGPRQLLGAASGPHTRLPVFGQTRDRVLGVLHLEDVIARTLELESEATAEALMRPAFRISGELRADQALAILGERQVELAIVDGLDGAWLGIITVADLLAGVLDLSPPARTLSTHQSPQLGRRRRHGARGPAPDLGGA